MRAAVLRGPGDVAIEERPVPRPGPAQVVVRVRSVGVCGSDAHYYEHGRIGRFVVEAPLVLGHEASGEVVELGPDVTRLTVGQRVAIEPGVPDLTCEQCLAGRYNLCPDMRFFATPPIDGALAEYVVVHEAFAHPVPEVISDDAAALLEPLSVGLWACRKARVSAGDRVLVTGAGPIGLYAAQVARAFGAGTVTVTDISDFRLDTARKLGLNAERADSPLDSTFDVLLECSGAAPALTSGMKRLAPAGRIVLVGMGADTVSIDVPLLQGKELTLTGIFRYANTYPTALQLIAAGSVDVESVITHRFDLEHTEDALTLGRRDAESLKAVVLPTA
jgi:L-iditol 2-dehydrogenase